MVKLRLGVLTMRIFVPKEQHPTERRVPLLPNGAAKLTKLGAVIEVEQALGAKLNCQDSEYENAGAKISVDRVQSLAEADMVLRLRKPPSDEVARLKKGCIHASFLDPFNERELILRLAAAAARSASLPRRVRRCEACTAVNMPSPCCQVCGAPPRPAANRRGDVDIWLELIGNPDLLRQIRGMSHHQLLAWADDEPRARMAAIVRGWKPGWAYHHLRERRFAGDAA